MTSIQLDLGDAAEPAEMLTFLGDWITHEPATVTESLTRFIGVTGYDLLTLRADLARFTFLLTGDDADHLFGNSTRP